MGQLLVLDVIGLNFDLGQPLDELGQVGVLEPLLVGLERRLDLGKQSVTPLV